MKHNLKRMLALILAMSMTLSLLSTSAWAADTSGDSSDLSTVSTVEPQEGETEETSAPEETTGGEKTEDEKKPEGKKKSENEDQPQEAEEPEKQVKAETESKEVQPQTKKTVRKQSKLSSGMGLTTYAAESKNIGTDVVYAVGDTIVLPEGGSYFKFSKYSNTELKSGNSIVASITDRHGSTYEIETDGDWRSYFDIDTYDYKEYIDQGLVVVGIKFSGSGTSDSPYTPLLVFGELDAAWEGDGEGSESSPYLINDLNDLKALSSNVENGMLYTGKYFKLTSDINCGEENWNPIGGTKQFKGTFDGNGKTITYKVTNNTEYEERGLGLFYATAACGTIKNLNVSASIVSDSRYGQNYGGIAALNYGTITNCSSNVNITSLGEDIGGIVGINYGTISYCAASGSITWNRTGSSFTAGITGLVYFDGTVTNCASLCNISAVNANEDSYAGRVIGRKFGSVTDCYYLSTATITGDHVGTNDATEKTADELKVIGEEAYNAGYKVYALALGYTPNTHSFTYEASGDTITATCSAEDCDLTDSKATLTIAAPENLAYDGTAKEAVITDEDNIRGEATVNYYKVENDTKGEALTGAPTDAGKYWAEITLANAENDSTATAHVVYEITLGTVDISASLNVTGNDGTTCRAAILDENYNEIDSVTKKAGEKFILLVNREGEYDFEVTGATTTEFTEEDYTAYVDYANTHNNYISLNSVLFWVTMPGGEDESATVTVTFKKLHTYTILYQPVAESNADIVACKIVRSVNSSDETSNTFLQRGATMGNGIAVWSMQMTAAFAPKQVAFYEANSSTLDYQMTFETAFQGINMNTVALSQNTDAWTEITGGGKYLIIGGEAKVVTAVFITDVSKMTTYKDNMVDAPETTDGETYATYQFAVCQTDENGKVNTAGTVKAPPAPTTAPEGKEFAGWRGFQYDSNGKASEKIYAANENNIQVRENATFTAVWRPKKLTVNLYLNGGSGIDNTNFTVSYEDKLPALATPTKSGFAFDGWTVSEAVTENGTYFAKGSAFDLNTPITANLKLTAKWKHVHSYYCFRVTSFPGLSAYHKYDSAVHIAVCTCGDVQLMAHEFDANGKCACGYEKPGPKPVTLYISYGQWSGGNYTEKMAGMPEEAKQGEEVSISAPLNWGNLEFSKWQYSAGDGEWADLTADSYASFIIPQTMYVRALYINPVTAPQVDLSARPYDDQAEVNGQTYTMDNILFHLNYKLPDGYTFEDAGIKLGDNNGISYYFIQQVRVSLDNECKGILLGMSIAFSAVGAATQGFPTTGPFDVGVAMFAEGYGVKYLETEDNVLDKELDAATLAQYMYEGKPVNVEKYPPIYWEAKAVTKGMSGSMETLPPLRFAQKYGGRHYIYGIGWMRYKDSGGTIHTIYTEALPATVKNIPTNTVTKSGS